MEGARTLFAKLRTAVRAAEVRQQQQLGAADHPLAPSPRGALLGSSAEEEEEEEEGGGTARAACAADSVAAAAGALGGALGGAPFARVSGSLAASLCGVVPLTPHILLAPRRVLRSACLLHALRVQQIVCCGIEPPAHGSHGGLPCLQLGSTYDAPAEARAISKLVDRAAAASRTTLLVGDEAAGGCVALATALLELREGATHFHAALRAGHACPFGA